MGCRSGEGKRGARRRQKAGSGGGGPRAWWGGDACGEASGKGTVGRPRPALRGCCGWKGGGGAWAAAVGGGSGSAGGSPSSLPSPPGVVRLTKSGSPSLTLHFSAISRLTAATSPFSAASCSLPISGPSEVPSPAGVACGGRTARRHHLVGWGMGRPSKRRQQQRPQRHRGEGRPPTPPTLCCAGGVWPSAAGWWP